MESLERDPSETDSNGAFKSTVEVLAGDPYATRGLIGEAQIDAQLQHPGSRLLTTFYLPFDFAENLRAAEFGRQSFKKVSIERSWIDEHANDIPSTLLTPFTDPDEF